MSKKFKPPHLQCNECKEIIYSRHPGEFVVCKCYVSSKNQCDIMVENEIKQNPKLIGDDKALHQLRCDLAKAYGTGIFIDSTKEYTRWGGSGMDEGKAGITWIKKDEETEH